MSTSFRVHLPDRDKVVVCRFDLARRQVELEHDEDHYLLLGFDTMVTCLLPPGTPVKVESATTQSAKCHAS